MEELLKKSVVAIVDCEYTYNNYAYKLFPQIVSSCLVISVDVIRNAKFTNNEDIKQFGNKQLMYWIPDKFKSSFSDLSSISAARHKKDMSIARPKICFTIAWNDSMDIGYGELFRQLKYFLNYDIFCNTY